jgi:YgiT-type zinc finger domain-containing protein
MRCHVCGARMEAVVTTLPFKVRDRTTVMIKGVPVRQCAKCSEYLLAMP